MGRRRLLRSGRPLRIVAAGLAVTLTAGLATAPAAQAGLPLAGRPKVADGERRVDGKNLKVRPRAQDPATRSEPATRAAWPKPGTAELEASGRQAERSGTSQGLVRAKGLPVALAAPGPGGAQAGPALKGQVKVAVLDRATARRSGVEGLMFTLAPAGQGASGRVGVRVDYAAFAQAFGGSYGTRLRLVQLPACVLSAPAKAECRAATPIPTVNNGETQTLTADVNTNAQNGPAMLAAVAAPEGPQGDYSATKLTPSATWGTSGNTGDFTWSYPMRVVPVPGGLEPEIGLNYSSQSVDGRTVNTNSQPSWAGEGFDYWPGFIEQRYKACADDGAPKDGQGKSPGDLCWGYENATITWNGKGGELVKAANNTWRLKNDDGTRFEKLTSTETGNGDHEGEYWKVTTTDGTRYYFGLNRLPGFGSGGPESNSAWTVPVFGDDAGEPCHKASGFADSWCQQAWRWNLDMVVDPDDNAAIYLYDKEINHYGRNLKPADATPYTRGGYLKTIEYGLRGDNVFAGAPPARIMFDKAERCIPTDSFDCAPAKIKTNPEQWRDVPWDMNCDAGTRCEDGHGSTSPTFWSRYRLKKITTEYNRGSGWGYRPIDSWTLDHRWGAVTDERDLLLKEIQHTGKAGPTADDDITLPKVTFTHVARANRVDQAGDGLPSYTRYRVDKIFDESGGELNITYSGQDCARTSLPKPESNTRRCYPLKWHLPDRTEPLTDWFNTYVVTGVVQRDRTGRAPDTATRYEYLGGAAWHFDDDDGLTREKNKTWSQWRGYGQVRVTSGSPDNPSTRTDSFYLRGMDGDRAGPDGGTKNVTVPDGEGGTIVDHNAWAGYKYRTVNYNGPSGAVVSKAVDTPWRHQTASRTRDWGTVTANLTGTARNRSFTAMDNGTWRETRIDNTFDTGGDGGTSVPVGRITMSDDLGDVTDPADDRCTRTTYKDNTSDWLLTYPNRVDSVAVKCSVTPDRATKEDGQPGQVISDVRTSYDGNGWNTPPTRGNGSVVERLIAHDGTEPTYQRTVSTEYDHFGRPTAVTDAKGQVITTSYTDQDGLTRRTRVTSPRTDPGDPSTAHTTVTDYEPAYGSPLTKTDAAGKRTEIAYDALGRVTKVWFPDRPKSRFTPTVEYSYQVQENKIVAIGTRTLNAAGEQRPPTYTLYDGLLRPRQTQVHGPGGDKLVAETLYNSLGKPHRVYEPYYADGAPGPSLWAATTPSDIETQTEFTYDGLGRVTKKALVDGGGDGPQLWATTTGYGGGRVTVDPPSGGTPSISYADARGRLTEVRHYHADSPTGDDYDVTRYTYAPGGQIKTVTGPVNSKATGDPAATWTSYYDQVGRKIKTDDPDKGVTTYAYDELDRITATIDARGQKISTHYDPLGRVIRTTDGAGNVLTSNVYDTLAKGQLTSNTRRAKDRGGAVSDYTTTVGGYDDLYRPTSTTVSIPGAEGLGTRFTYASTFNADGTLKTSTVPAAGDLPAETITHEYDDLARPTTLRSNLSSYVTGSTYSPTGKPLQYELSAGQKKAWLSYQYQDVTQRPSRLQVTREGATARPDLDSTYSYDDAGNIRQIADTSPAGQDTQCFRYDHMRRLTDAWSQAGTGCPSGDTEPTIGGPAPYRFQYKYATDGSRTDEKQYHKDAGGAVQTTTRSYKYARDVPGYTGHQLAEVAQTGASPFSGAAGKETYAYDKTGNTTARTRTFTENGTTTTRTQTFEYDTEGEINAITQQQTGKPDENHSFVYDTDGQRLIKRDATGVTLYLPGMEVKLPTGATRPTATRYYAHAGQTIATRTAAGVTFLAPDHQGTSLLSIGAMGQTLAQRRTTPFGQERGTTGTWPTSMDKGFVGGTKDTTSLTHLGAREYDPNTGRFTTVDPEFDFSWPQSWNGYAYADNNVPTSADPTGTDGPLTGNTECYYANKNCDASPAPPSSGSPAPPPTKKKKWYQKGPVGPVLNGFNGYVDGAVNQFTGLVSFPGQVSMSMAGATMTNHCASKGYGSACAATGKPPAPPEVHVPIGGDPKTKSYRIGRIIGDIIGIPIPGAVGLRGIRTVAKLPRLIKSIAANLAKKTPRETAEKAQPTPPSWVYKPGGPDRPGPDPTRQADLPPGAGIKPGEKLRPGRHDYIVREDGSLRAMHEDDLRRMNAGHASLADHQSVIMAGVFDVNKVGKIEFFQNWSGHYWPQQVENYRSLEEISRTAFARHGLPEPGPGTWHPRDDYPESP
ncbi:RHS repeat-associated protein [Actinomadura pelletieri DSM 43383]|uniref:RHS repeat-associated protein n=1 Tax=Actinomadura pelletieri DSM 43383 TaxID=1120940 RepID=A0A495QAG9_9ACTN|nr:RHS repeat-associated protein [Actinomadura pelletieri DSM 43383]